eukprot:TRINITY_DN69378_c0_g1_i1.p1 TRINITY_DN69378_c0_g1~~TRINITY_DN69378_c0_g1_i1.p1  ORF type:complete len:609 (+),score=175.46 TRINITY_DN69378_c0_g1_i1:93-1919(+)
MACAFPESTNLLSLGDDLAEAFAFFIDAQCEERVLPAVEELKGVVSLLQGAFASRIAELQADVANLKASVGKKAAAADVEELERSVTALGAVVKQKAESARVEQVAEKCGVDVLELRDGLRAGTESFSQRFEASLGLFRERLESFEAATSANSRQLQESVAELRERHESSVKASSKSMKQLEAASHRATADLAGLNQALADKVAAGHFEKLVSDLATTGARIADVERVLQDKVNHETLKALQGRFPQVEQAAKDSAERVRQLEADVAGVGKQTLELEQSLRDKVSFSQIRQFETIVAGLQTNLSTLEQGLHDKAGAGQIAKLRTDFGGFEAKLDEVDQVLHEKVNTSQMQSLKANVTGLESKIVVVEQSVQEKVGSGQMQQLKGIIMGIQKQLSGMETGIKEKIGGEQLHQIKNTIASVQAQVSCVEQGLHEKVDAGQLHQVRNLVAGVETKFGSLEQSLQEKVPAIEVQQLNETIASMATKITGMERSVWEGMDLVQQLEGVISHIKAQTSSVEQAVREKVGGQELNLLSETVAAVKSKMAMIERSVGAGTDRVHQVEEAIGGLGSQFGVLRKAMQEQVGVHKRQRQVVDFEVFHANAQPHVAEEGN